jgi:CheY-like chemotaxis protein
VHIREVAGGFILLIEDNAADVYLVEQALQAHHVEAPLTVLRDGEQGLRFIEAVESGLMECPALIVLDLNLPKVPGHQILARMRSTSTCSKVPVIVLSSSKAPADTQESKRLDVQRHIQKPATFDEFMQIGAVFKAFFTGREH